MKLCYVLPKTETKAIGGYKIVYEYANRLSDMGHDVTILYLNTNYLKQYHVPKIIKKVYFDRLVVREPKWFQLNSRVTQISDYSKKKVKALYENADVAIATAVKTAPYVKTNFKSKNKFYFIQGRENWSLTDEQVNETYCLGMKNIVISHWLKNIVDEVTETDSLLLPNPIDTEKYKVINPIENRQKFTIGCLYNPNPCKGFDNSFRVLTKLKTAYPEVKVVIFGAYDRPNYFPNWIDYVKNATQDKTINIYNNISVFLCSTIDEGYGLTGLESMACGCALCSTNYNAVYEYAEDGINCLLSPVYDIDAQVDNVSKLFNNDKMRKNIAHNATKSVSKFSWDITIDKFLSLIE